MPSMWTLRTRSKRAGKKKSPRAVRKGGPRALRHDFRSGDRVRIIDIARELKDPDYKDDPQMRTAELFRFCLGRRFTISGFDQYGFVELQVDRDPEAKRKFGLNWIWMEPQYLELVSKARGKVARERGFS